MSNPSGADSRTRTGDPRITNALLYQLSHIGKADAKVRFFFKMQKCNAFFIANSYLFIWLFPV